MALVNFSATRTEFHLFANENGQQGDNYSLMQMKEMETGLRTLVCLPAYNEELAIAGMIASIREQGWEVMVSDGGSADRTVEIAEKLDVMVLSRPGKGKGFGMSQSLKYAFSLGYDVAVFIDCDGTYPVLQIKHLVEKISDCDMAVGARKMQSIVLLNRAANYLFTGLINILFTARLKDTQSGLRALRVNKFQNFISATSFDVEAELTCKAIKKGYAIKEVVIDYYPRIGKSKVAFKDAFLILFRILRCKIAA